MFEEILSLKSNRVGSLDLSGEVFERSVEKECQVLIERVKGEERGGEREIKRS